MKKLIIAAVFLLATTVTYAGPIITISVEFGHKDANKVCIERGICDVTFGVSRSMTATIDDNTGNLELVFKKNEAQNKVYQMQFINGVFDIPVSYALSSGICSKLGVDKFTIKAGKYKVEETNNQYKIILTK